MRYDYGTSGFGYRKSHDWFVIGVVLAIVLAIAAPIGYVVALHSSERTVTTTVRNHERVCNSGGGSCQYLVYTDAGTFKDTDSFVFWKFRSSDLYGQLKNNENYTFKVTGWRLPFVSGYPNIIAIESDNGPSS